MWDCRKGECGLCEMAVVGIEGRLDHRDVFLSDAQKADGRRVCLCVAAPWPPRKVRRRSSRLGSPDSLGAAGTPRAVTVVDSAGRGAPNAPESRCSATCLRGQRGATYGL